MLAWDPILSYCSTLNYTIISTNCGHCLPPASNTSTLCTNVPLSRHPCSFAIRTEVCGRITGRESEPILVNFQGNFDFLKFVICQCTDTGAKLHLYSCRSTDT